MAAFAGALLVACTRPPDPAAIRDPPSFSPPVCRLELPDSPELRVPYLSEGKWGVADRASALVVEPVYDQIRISRHGPMAVRRGDSWGLLDGDGHELLPVEWQQLGVASASRVTVRDHSGRMQLLDMCGQLALPGHYDDLYAGGRFVIARRGDYWALLDDFGEPIVGWSPTPMARFGAAIVRRGEAGHMVLHDDGRAWAPAFRDGEVQVIWPGALALLTTDRPFTEHASSCLYDANGGVLVPCGVYLELSPLSDAPPLLWARTDTGWGLIEVTDAGPPRTRIEHRYVARTNDGLLDGSERIVVDAEGRIVERRPAAELESGPLPDRCGELVSWRRTREGLEYLDGDGEVREQSSSQAGHGRWQPIREGDLWGIRDACERGWIIAPRYEWLQPCGDERILAHRSSGYELHRLDRLDAPVVEFDAPWAECDDDLIFTHFGGGVGLRDHDGRELLAPRFLNIDHIDHIGGSAGSLLRLTYFDVDVFASVTGIRYFEEPLPAPGEFPETSAQLLTIEHLQTLDRTTLLRMREDLSARCRYFNLREPRAGPAPLEAANLELLERALEPRHEEAEVQ